MYTYINYTNCFASSLYAAINLNIKSDFLDISSADIKQYLIWHMTNELPSGFGNTNIIVKTCKFHSNYRNTDNLLLSTFSMPSFRTDLAQLESVYSNMYTKLPTKGNIKIHNQSCDEATLKKYIYKSVPSLMITEKHYNNHIIIDNNVSLLERELPEWLSNDLSNQLLKLQ